MKRFLAIVMLMCCLALVTGQTACKTCDARGSTQATVCDHTSVNCPNCGQMAMWTGSTRILNGKTWYVMKCTSQHRFLSQTQ